MRNRSHGGIRPAARRAHPRARRAAVLWSLLTFGSAPGLLAAPGLSGEPGLVFVPTADPVPRGQYSVGINVAERAFRPYPSSEKDTIVHFLNVGLAPALDVTVRVTSFDGKPFARYYRPGEWADFTNKWGYPLGGYMVDRSIGARLRVLRQQGLRPAVALGTRDPTGTQMLSAEYAVGSWRFPNPADAAAPGVRWGIHVGTGTGRLSGVFAGLECQPTPWLSLSVERALGDTHLGAHWRITRRLQLQPVLLGMRRFGGGMVYTSSL
ncbi:MAG: YjbH domain-containing protein [Armatimonadetes bacterium]|nr:YjbH domain-containing protein [Armatimonadota bacterium]